MMITIEEFLGPLWAYSALMLGITALVIVWFIPLVTQGAGFNCLLAFMRLVQRICLSCLALACAAAALHILQVRHNPPPVWLFLHASFAMSALSSLIRHLWAPNIPIGTTWRHPVLPKDIQIKSL